MKLENNILNEIIQVQNVKYHMFSQSLASNFIYVFLCGDEHGQMPGRPKRAHERGKIDLKGGVWKGQQNTCDTDVDRKILGDEGNMGGSGGRYQSKLSMYEMA